MDKYEEFLILSSDSLRRMRLIIEGAIIFHQHDAMPLYWLGHKNNMDEAAFGFDIIGSALTELRNLIISTTDELFKAWK